MEPSNIDRKKKKVHERILSYFINPEERSQIQTDMFTYNKYFCISSLQWTTS